MKSADLSNYERQQKLGEGTYGEVYRAIDKTTNEVVAMKVMRLDHEDEGISQTTLRECTILRSLNHFNIISLKEISFNNDSLVLVCEYLSYDLRKLLKKHQKPLNPDLVRSYAYQLLSGIYYLHTHRVIHRDIKPENLLIDKAGRMKICDFGLSRFFTIPMREFTEGVITLWYRPLEVLLHNPFYDLSIDIWSAGCVIAEMTRGTAIFKGDSELDMIHQIFKTLGTPDQGVLSLFADIKNNKVTIPQYPRQNLHTILETDDDLLVDLISKMLEIDPKKRINAKDARRHPYFDNLPDAIRNFSKTEPE